MKFQHVHDDCTEYYQKIMLNDEKYFLLHNESNRAFYTSDPSAAPPEVKFKCTKKFEPKIMVWIAVSENGISKPFFSEQQHKLLTSINVLKPV